MTTGRRRIAGAAVAAVLLLAGCSSNDDAPSDDSPTTQGSEQAPGTEAGDLDRNQGQEKDQTRPDQP
ncbi:hypothetical protein NHL50_06660 [Acidimicrobiia bacterium EGI L10123]|uniref:hypothetical protein n=1 Tax=Salinilacustrithrix flava TaxID=2957203 RepID=UPI003D7C1ED2|nr:hypothetical protein [Acidimicrobiia bacterium EGI L10123]